MFDKVLKAIRARGWHFSEYRPRIGQSGRCERAAVYDRTGMSVEKVPPDAAGLDKMAEGNLHEEDIFRQLNIMGVPIRDRQRCINIRANTHTGEIRGKIDGIITVTEFFLTFVKSLQIEIPEWATVGDYLCEAKSTDDWTFKNMREPLDNGYAQVMPYLHQLLIEEGISKAVFIYKNRRDGDWKVFFVPYNLTPVIKAIQKFERIEENYKRGVLPGRMGKNPEEYPCGWCEFRKTCWDGWEKEFQQYQAAWIPENLEQPARRYMDLKLKEKEIADEIEDLNELLKVELSNQQVKFARVTETQAIRLDLCNGKGGKQHLRLEIVQTPERVQR